MAQLNIPFAGKIVDENENIIAGAFVQALYIGDDGTILWDSHVRITDNYGNYFINLGDDTFATVSNLVNTNGSNGKVLINAWVHNQDRNGYLDKLGSSYIIMKNLNVYVNDIQIKPIEAIECSYWHIDDSGYHNETITAESFNTNEHIYIYDNRKHYQYQYLSNELIFDSLGPKVIEYNWGDGWTTNNTHVLDSVGLLTVEHKVSSFYDVSNICTQTVSIFNRIDGFLEWTPIKPKVGETVIFTPTFLYDIDSIYKVEYVINNVHYIIEDITNSFSYINTTLLPDNISFIIYYNDGFTNQEFQLDYIITKTNIPPEINLEVIKPTIDSRYIFKHNGTDIDGYIEKVQWVLERNNPDRFHQDNWSIFLDTGIITNLDDYSYDFSQLTGEFRLKAIVYDDWGASAEETYIISIDCSTGIDLANVDWTKNVHKTIFQIKSKQLLFSSSKNKKLWKYNKSIIKWKVENISIDFETKVKPIEWIYKNCKT